jgi:hypothetical protein
LRANWQIVVREAPAPRRIPARLAVVLERLMYGTLKNVEHREN